jgi:hypothetical protein
LVEKRFAIGERNDPADYFERRDEETRRDKAAKRCRAPQSRYISHAGRAMCFHRRKLSALVLDKYRVVSGSDDVSGLSAHELPLNSLVLDLGER